MIQLYDDKYKKEVIDLILYVQNVEYEVGITIEEQPDILDIKKNYIDNGGHFWIALNQEGNVIGSIGLEKKTKKVAVLKKFFVYKKYRGREHGVGMKLYNSLLDFAKNQNISTIILDTPSKANRSHNFYKKVGFLEISKEALPISYEYADRDSLIFRLDLL